jgi:hypothetical protein
MFTKPPLASSAALGVNVPEEVNCWKLVVAAAEACTVLFGNVSPDVPSIEKDMIYSNAWI